MEPAGARPLPLPVAVNAAGVGPAATLKGNAIPRYQIPRTIMRLQQSFIPSNPQIIAIVLPPPAISSGRGTVAGVDDVAVSQQLSANSSHSKKARLCLLQDKNGRIPSACTSDAFPVH